MNSSLYADLIFHFIQKKMKVWSNNRNAIVWKKAYSYRLRKKLKLSFYFPWTARTFTFLLNKKNSRTVQQALSSTMIAFSLNGVHLGCRKCSTMNCNHSMSSYDIYVLYHSFQCLFAKQFNFVFCPKSFVCELVWKMNPFLDKENEASHLVLVGRSNLLILSLSESY